MRELAWILFHPVRHICSCCAPLFFFLFLGHRSDSCRLYEMQAFLVELISNFEFAITEDIKRLRREPCLVMVPVLEGELEKGAQLPLRVSIAQRECE